MQHNCQQHTSSIHRNEPALDKTVVQDGVQGNSAAYPCSAHIYEALQGWICHVGQGMAIP